MNFTSRDTSLTPRTLNVPRCERPLTFEKHFGPSGPPNTRMALSETAPSLCTSGPLSHGPQHRDVCFLAPSILPPAVARLASQPNMSRRKNDIIIVDKRACLSRSTCAFDCHASLWHIPSIAHSNTYRKPRCAIRGKCTIYFLAAQQTSISPRSRIGHARCPRNSQRTHNPLPYSPLKVNFKPTCVHLPPRPARSRLLVVSYASLHQAGSPGFHHPHALGCMHALQG